MIYLNGIKHGKFQLTRLSIKRKSNFFVAEQFGLLNGIWITKIITAANTVFKQTRAVLVVAGSGVSPTLFRVIQNWFLIPWLS